MNIKLNGLKEGAYRELGEEEKAELLRLVEKGR
jgi:16S rRNA U516 pseudouridylate synthase RsuA-like enzyme